MLGESGDFTTRAARSDSIPPMRLLLVLISTVTLSAQDAPSLRRFIVAGPIDASRWLKATPPEGASVPSLSGLAYREPLTPGFHVVDAPGFAPRLRYAIVVPQTESPDAGRALIVAAAPASSPLPPDELTIRASYGSFLEAGCVVLVPIAAHLTGVPVPSDEAAARNVWNKGRDLLPGLVADCAMRTRIDRDRVVLLPRWTDQPSDLNQPAWPDVDATPFAAVWVLLPAGATPTPAPDPGRWAGRRVVLHCSTHRRDERLLMAGQLRRRGITVDVVRDRGLDWASMVQPTLATVREALARISRAQVPARLSFHAGRPHPGDHEWISSSSARARLRVERAVGTISITTPGTERRAPFPLQIWFAEDPGEITVSVNGRPVFGGSVPHDKLAALRCLRRTARSGRRTTRVLTIRP